MTRVRKILPGVGIGLLLAGILVASLWPQRGQLPVEVARVERRNLVATVRATGQIVPRVYTNVLGQNFGQIKQILVHEGQYVRAGHVLLKVHSVQAAAAVREEQASLASAKAGLQAAKAALRGAQASVAEHEADIRTASFNWEQGQKLYQAQLISRQDFESYRSAYENARAALDNARDQVLSARDQIAQAARQIEQIEATLVHTSDVLRQMTYRAPISGTVTNIAVRVGENVIQGVPEANGAYLMTISDLSNLIAQVGVDENDITLLHRGQPVTVRIDAFPGQEFAGQVTRVGAQAILTATGTATSQVVGGGSAQQATEYKVNISLGQLPPGLRPGMTVNTVIQTANRKNVIGVPFQALVLRPASEAGQTSIRRTRPDEPVQIAVDTQKQKAKPAGVIGVFVVRSGRAIFTPVKIGVLGENYVEAREGLRPGEPIVVGGYTALRELHSGMAVRIIQKK
jgi:HlyD family secretion protein